MHPSTSVDPLDTDLFTQFSNDEINVTESIHVFEHTANLYKCAGHVYEDNGETLGQTYYVVMKTVDVPIGITVYDIIVANVTIGFLESVSSVKETTSGLFVQTTLVQCDPTSIPGLDIDLSIVSDMSCYGGDGWPGMTHLTQPSQDNGNLVSKIFPARYSGPVMAIALDISQSSSGFTFIEVRNGSILHTITPVKEFV